MKAVIVIGKNYTFDKMDFADAYVIGVDKGAILCYQNSIPMDMAIGDFDSITQEELAILKEVTQVRILNPIKDETDTKAAILQCKDCDEITILGGISGKRIEHFYANILLLKSFPKVKIKDDNSFIFTTTENVIISKLQYKYVSIFSLDENTFVTLNGFKYPLANYLMIPENPIGISNEILDSQAEISLSSGRVLIILSKNDNKEEV